MGKDITMRKSTFVKGAFITTIGIIITKLLGIFYVIPFHAVIGDEGGALYGYAYTIYTVFMSLASAGIPLAISRIVSEYQTLGYYTIKKRVFVLGKRIALLLGFICFLIILLFAPFLARTVLGDVVGGNSVEDVTFVIRVIGSAILIVPVLSIYRGYFEGHRLFSPPSISQVIEQLVRVFVIIFGSFLALKVFHLKMSTAVGIALFGATLGAFVSYFYLLEKKIRNNGRFQERVRTVNEPIITNKVIIQKIFWYAIPFILIDIFKSLYNAVDMVTVVKGLVHSVGYQTADAEIVYSMLSTWALKFNMIVLSISTGVIVSLIPNLTESVVKGDQKEIQKKISQALSVLLYLTVPLTLGISFLAKPIWTLFYGNSVYGPSILSFYIFVGLFVGLFTAMVTTMQTLKDYKVVIISLVLGVVLKILFNHSLMMAFYKMSLPAYYGFMAASIIGYGFSFVFCLINLHVKYHISFEEVLRNFVDIMFGSLLMILGLFLIGFIIPVSFDARIFNLFSIFFYGIVGMIIYFVYAHFVKLTNRILGKNVILTIRKILLRK